MKRTTQFGRWWFAVGLYSASLRAELWVEGNSLRKVLVLLLLAALAITAFVWLNSHPPAIAVDVAKAVPPSRTAANVSGRYAAAKSEEPKSSSGASSEPSSGPSSEPRYGTSSEPFVGSDSCQTCHPSQHESWHRSYHRTMTQLATDENVLAPFDMADDSSIDVGGQTYRMFRLDADETESNATAPPTSTYWVEMDDPEWERAIFTANGDVRQQPKAQRVTAQIVMTTGSHHFQAYWVRSAYGRELWQFPLRYDLVEEKWVHRKDVFLGPPEWRPGMHFKVWNDNCIFCHATGGQPGLDSETSLMANTTVGELGIACESCHGPGRAHVNKQEALGQKQVAVAESDSAESDPALDDTDPTIVNPAKLDHERASEICGSCHSNFLHDDPNVMVTGPQFRPGRRLTEFGRFFSPQLESEHDIVSRFWSDGVNRSTGREFMGLKNSPCYKRGEVSCLSCHSMHESDPDDQLAVQMETNAACLQCHEQFRDDIESHTHHAADSEGSLCYNCHMPYTNYGLFKATRSHQITSPVVTSIEHKSRPNACNLCHLDQTLEWTADALNEWYGQPKPSLQEDENTVSAWALLALRGDAGQRAIAAWHPRWPAAQQASGSDWMKPILKQLESDPYAAVNYVAKVSAKRLATNQSVDTDPDGKTLEVLGLNADASISRFIEEVLLRRDDRPIASVE